GPDFRQFGVDRQPGLHPRFGIRPDSIDRTFRLADAAIDALAGVDHQHVLARVEAVHWADLHAIGVLAGDARFGDDIGHGGPHFRLYTNDNAVTLALSRSMNVRGNSARCKQRNTPRPQGRGALTLWSDLAQSVLAGDFLDLQPAHPWEGTAAVGHGHGDDDLVRARRIVEADLDPVEMRAHEGRVLVAERNVQVLPHAAALFGGRHQGGALFNRLAQRR